MEGHVRRLDPLFERDGIKSILPASASWPCGAAETVNRLGGTRQPHGQLTNDTMIIGPPMSKRGLIRRRPTKSEGTMLFMIAAFVFTLTIALLVGVEA